MLKNLLLLTLKGGDGSGWFAEDGHVPQGKSKSKLDVSHLSEEDYDDLKRKVVGYFNPVYGSRFTNRLLYLDKSWLQS